MSSVPGKAGPADNDIVLTTNRFKRGTAGTKRFLLLVKEHFEEYVCIDKKISPKKRKIAEDIVDALRPGRFMKEENGQWKVLSTEDAVNRIIQRFCDEKRAAARSGRPTPGRPRLAAGSD